MVGKVQIHGHIGDSFVDQQGQLHKGTNLLSVIEQVETFPDATEYEILINSPGGYVDVGDSIYDYLVSLKKKGKKVTTIQTGLIGSIATKIFLAGDRRIVDDRYKFWIHNPFQENVSGDQDALRAAADAVAQTEKDLRKFYAEYTQITDEGLDGLMKIETGLTADQCLKFKFATEKKLVPAFNLIKNEIMTGDIVQVKEDAPDHLNELKGMDLEVVETAANALALKTPSGKVHYWAVSDEVQIKKQNKKTMKPEEKSLKEQLLALLGVKQEDKKGVKPKAAIPAGAADKSLVVNLADDAGSFYVSGEALVDGAECKLLDADGNPTDEDVEDGVYNTAEGAVVTVAAGKIAKVEMPADPDEEEMTEEKIDAKVEAKIKEKEAELEKKFEALTLALKKEVKLGVQPKPAVLGLKLEGEKTFKTISQIQQEKELAKKKTR